MISWIDDHFRDICLDEVLRKEGRGRMWGSNECITCGAPEGRFRCQSCFGQGHWCRNCIVACHANNPFHIVEVIDICVYPMLLGIQAKDTSRVGMALVLGKYPCPRWDFVSNSVIVSERCVIIPRQLPRVVHLP